MYRKLYIGRGKGKYCFPFLHPDYLSSFQLVKETRECTFFSPFVASWERKEKGKYIRFK